MEHPSPEAPTTFEEALSRLEAIAAALDRNDLPLAEALRLVSEAATLRQFCHTRLTEAEGQLHRLAERDGDSHLEPLTDA